ncbi:hypothetical protein [uncultured Pseudokineococcus sp.]|uniref:hypothetical protein n=1 Tax=uncultured Pseudokineococcus sp. TaxID=1642928 RepID=UPI00260EA76A|nr:hypothetical protein [uncultured Pseudokineococcus sp.]
MPARHRTARAAAAALLATPLLLAGASAGADSSTTVPVGAAASAAAPGLSVTATDAPPRLRVGARTQTFRLTVITSDRVDATSTTLVDRRGKALTEAISTGPEPRRPGVQKSSLTLSDRDITHWGSMRWSVSAWRTSDGSCALADRSMSVDVRAHSMLGLATSRSGSTVTVRGSLRAYATTVHRYASWSGRPVSIQRWDGSTWRQVAGTTTDRNGNLTARLSVPRGSSLRLVTPDTPAIWGATSATGRA